MDPVGIERDVPLDLRNSRKRILIRPHGIEGLISSSGNAVVTALAFIRTVGSVIGPFQLRKIHVIAWNILNSRIVLFPKSQGIARIDHDPVRHRYIEACWTSMD